MSVFTFHNNRWCAKTGSCTQCVQWLADRLLACKAGVFCTANDLDVQTYRELGRVKKWIQGRGWRIKIGEGEEQGYPFSPRPFPLPGPPPCTSRSRFFFFKENALQANWLYKRKKITMMKLYPFQIGCQPAGHLGVSVDWLCVATTGPGASHTEHLLT